MSCTPEPVTLEIGAEDMKAEGNKGFNKGRNASQHNILCRGAENQYKICSFPRQRYNFHFTRPSHSFEKYFCTINMLMNTPRGRICTIPRPNPVCRIASVASGVRR